MSWLSDQQLKARYADEWKADVARWRGFLPARVRTDGDVDQYVCCRHCGHRLRLNQGLYQLRHSFKHSAIDEMHPLAVASRIGVDLSTVYKTQEELQAKGLLTPRG